MSSFEISQAESVESVGPDKLSIEDIALLLGASVVISVRNPLHALQIYQQRQAEIRNQTQDENQS